MIDQALALQVAEALDRMLAAGLPVGRDLIELRNRCRSLAVVGRSPNEDDGEVPSIY